MSVSEALARSDTLQDVRLTVLQSSFERRSPVPDAPEPADGAIEVEGRLDLDLNPDSPSLGILTKLKYEVSPATGTITTHLHYEWAGGIEVGRNDLLEFARDHGVGSALPAAVALFQEGFLRFGVKMTFLPPFMVERVAGILIDGYRAQNPESK